MRKWVVNGCAYYEEGNDTNVDSIEEDIKYVTECLEIARVFFKAIKTETDYKELDDVAFCNSVEHLIEDYTRQKQINEEHQKINGELRTQIKFLEIKLEFKQWGDLDNLRFEEYMNEFVPKQRIIDFKNQIELEPVIVGGRKNGKTLEYGIKLGKIKACEELLS